ncbi:nucleoside monophosphate kinase [Candidatus Woesebacteria bacterium]|nr:nucleoside monophosphate kinase [Candidatus Woesebacteria bacterium]
MNVLFLGPQGSGKGTQAQKLSKKLEFVYFEAGDFLRNLAKTDERINETINNKGRLMPDQEMFDYIAGFLQERNVYEGIVFDGFPRSVTQYELLKKLLGEKNSKIDLAIYLDISEGETIRRLSARRICSRCGTIWNLITNPPPKEACSCGGSLEQRPDDTPEAIKERLNLYHSITQPLVELMVKEKILRKIDGERPIEVIFNEILEIVRAYGK